MKRLAQLLLIFSTATAMVAQTATLPAEPKLSPAQQSMAQAKRLIEKNPKNYEAYNALALALSRRARETSDAKFYAEAEETLKKSFEISPDNFDGKRIEVWLLRANTSSPRPVKKPSSSTRECRTTSWCTDF